MKTVWRGCKARGGAFNEGRACAKIAAAAAAAQAPLFFLRGTNAPISIGFATRPWVASPSSPSTPSPPHSVLCRHHHYSAATTTTAPRSRPQASDSKPSFGRPPPANTIAWAHGHVCAPAVTNNSTPTRHVMARCLHTGCRGVAARLAGLTDRQQRLPDLEFAAPWSEKSTSTGAAKNDSERRRLRSSTALRAHTPVIKFNYA